MIAIFVNRAELEGAVDEEAIIFPTRVYDHALIGALFGVDDIGIIKLLFEDCRDIGAEKATNEHYRSNSAAHETQSLPPFGRELLAECPKAYRGHQHIKERHEKGRQCDTEEGQ